MIDLTPLEVRKKKGDFRRIMRGYDPTLVDDFLDLAADRMDELVRETLALTERVNRQEQQVAEFRERERALTEALVTAQEMREEIRQQTSREAELVRRTAEQQAAELRSQTEQDTAQLRSKAEAEVAQLRSRTEAELAQLRTRIEREAAQLRAAAQQEAAQLRASAMQDRDREEQAFHEVRARREQFLVGYRAFLERELAELAVAERALGLAAAAGAAAAAAAAGARAAGALAASDVAGEGTTGDAAGGHEAGDDDAAGSEVPPVELAAGNVAGADLAGSGVADGDVAGGDAAARDMAGQPEEPDTAEAVHSAFAADADLDWSEIDDTPAAPDTPAAAPPVDVLDFSGFRFEGGATAPADDQPFSVEFGTADRDRTAAELVSDEDEAAGSAAFAIEDRAADLLDELDAFEPDPLEPFAPEPFEPYEDAELPGVAEPFEVTGPSELDDLFGATELSLAGEDPAAAETALYDGIAGDSTEDGIPGPIGLAQEDGDELILGGPDADRGELVLGEADEAGGELVLGEADEAGDELVLGEADEDDVQSQLLRNAAAAGFHVGGEFEDELLLEDAVEERDDMDDDGWLPSLLEDEK
jgi:cell division initiation protein